MGGAALFLLAAALLCISGASDDLRQSDVAVVLGNAVSRDGSPSPRLAARLDAAVTVWVDRRVGAIIVSGGVDRNGTDEAAAMRRYLVARRVPDAAIVVDPKGATTWETARNTAAIMRARNWRTVMVISQYFHIPRTRLALARFGVEDARSAHPAYLESRDLYSIAREVIGYPAYWFRDPTA
ncbi:YdcF family protein [Sphingomonas sp. HF-S3]|uniref:YdcF family protein n=2 Tax=Sphingomonas rustica TaxID=3103142 RepID=A0ABV0B605_9SPHN